MLITFDKGRVYIFFCNHFALKVEIWTLVCFCDSSLYIYSYVCVYFLGSMYIIHLLVLVNLKSQTDPL